VSSTACTILSRLSPFSWLAAAGLVTAQEIDVRLQVVGAVILLGMAAFAGTVCTLARDAGTYEKRLLVEAVRASQPGGERPASGHLRSVR